MELILAKAPLKCKISSSVKFEILSMPIVSVAILFELDKDLDLSFVVIFHDPHPDDEYVTASLINSSSSGIFKFPWLLENESLVLVLLKDFLHSSNSSVTLRILPKKFLAVSWISNFLIDPLFSFTKFQNSCFSVMKPMDMINPLGSNILFVNAQ